jgi:biopolymer transport protein ExbB
VSASEFVTRAMRNHLVESQARIEYGLTFLASVGSTAPFIGLFVAIPAVLAYNAYSRVNRLTLACLDGFAHDLHAYLTTGIAPSAGDKLVSLDGARAARAGG